MKKWSLIAGVLCGAVSCFADFTIDFTKKPDLFDSLKPMAGTAEHRGKKIRYEKGAFRTDALHGRFLYAGEQASTGRFTLSASNRWRSGIGLIVHSNADMSCYWQLNVEPYQKVVRLVRVDYGSKQRFEKNFKYDGSNSFTADLDFDGQNVTAWINGRKLITVPDHAKAKSGYTGILCGYWTNATFSKLSHVSAIPVQKHETVFAQKRQNLDVGRMNWDISKAYTKKNGLRTGISLNQIWQMQPVADYGKEASSSPADWGYFIIPGNWAQGIPNNLMHLADGRPILKYKGIDFPNNDCGVWLRRTFKVPAGSKGKKFELLFNNVNGKADFYFNGKHVGAKKDVGPATIRLDVTKFVKFDAENEIRVMNGGPKTTSAGLSDVKLNIIPGTNFGEVRIDTSVPKKELTLSFFEQTAGKDALLKTVIKDKKGKVLFRNEGAFTPVKKFSWIAPELWSPENPALYDLELTLSKGGKMLDQRTYRFGFRTFEAKNGHFYLNGHPIMVKAESAQSSINGWYLMRHLHNYDFQKGEFTKLKKLHYNTVYFNEAPTEEIAGLADEMGIMLLARTREASHRDLTEEPEKVMAYLEKALVDLKKNPQYYRHPSIIGFLIDVWYGYNAGCTNPNYVGQAKNDPNIAGILEIRMKLLNRIEKLHRKHFPDMVCFTGGSGAVGSVFGTHIYHTWGAPSTELRALYEKWNETRPLPIFAGETYVPYIGSFFEIDNFHGGGNPLSLENAARIFGPEAYLLKGVYTKRPFHDFTPDGWYWSTTEKTAFGNMGFPPDAHQKVTAVYLDEIVPGWRYHRLTGVGMFDYSDDCFTTQGVSRYAYKFTEKDLSLPGFKPEFPENGNARRPPCNPLAKDFGFRNTLLYASYKRNLEDLALVILDKTADPLLQDHSGFAGETIEKNVTVFNDTLKDQDFTMTAFLRSSAGGTVKLPSKSFRVAAGEHKLVPVSIRLPETASRSEWTFDVRLSGTAQLRASMKIQVFPRPQTKLVSTLPVSVYDPEGKIAQYMTGKIPFKKVSSPSEAQAPGLLIIGRNAVSMGDFAPDLDELASKGVNTLIMEQAKEASAELMKTRTRRTFINDPQHPVLQGFEDADFSFWKGSHSLIPAKEKGGAGINWSDWGSRNMVCGLAFRRPQFGPYKSLIVSGFDLFQTPLLEKTLANGKWIASQLEITERLGSDPVPTQLFANLVSYLGNPAKRGKALFFGSDPLVGKFALDVQKIDEINASTLASADTLLIADPDWQKLIDARLALAEFVYAGGKVVYWQSGEKFDPGFLPFTMNLQVKSAGARLASITGKANGFWRAGWNAGDLYWHEQMTLPAFGKLPSFMRSTSPAVIAEGDYGEGKWIFTTLRPEAFDKVPASKGKAIRVLSTLFTDAGIGIRENGRPFAISSRNDLDLVERKWEFSLDPQNIGLKEGWQFGKNGSGKWMKGLIADGIEVRVGQAFENFIRKNYDGFAWYRLHFDVPENLLQMKELYFVAAAIDDVDEVYLNGKKIGETTVKTPHYWETIRNYRIPAGLLKAKNNLLMVRVQDLRGGGGMTGLPIGLHPQKYNPSADRLWATPWPDALQRDYFYKSDIVRMY